MSKMNNNLFIDCKKEYDKYRKLQYDAEWDGRPKQADLYRQQALHYRELLKKGVLYEPKF
jgi:hypothetical protein|tara:strand:- start:321 stop:500 length:180 start_codon:yes stop_codon:yes gene_type:complete